MSVWPCRGHVVALCGHDRPSRGVHEREWPAGAAGAARAAGVLHPGDGADHARPPFLLYADEQQELKFTEQHLLPVDPMSAALHQHDLAGYVTYTRKDDPFANTRYDRDPIRVPVQQSITHSFDDQNAATFNQSIHPDVQPSFAFENEHFHNPLYVPPKIVAASQRPDFRAAQPGAHMGLQGLSAHFDT